MNRVNYQKELDKVLSGLKDYEGRPHLLLHCCCAPCSSYCLKYLRDYFDITCLFYNPNITDETEYNKRLDELKRLAGILNEDSINGIRVIDGGFEPSLFTDTGRGMENEPEGGRRCAACFGLRLDATARMAREESFDFFTTTLTISPLKDEQLINRIGKKCADKYGSIWLPSDFKKRDGYLESVRLSKEYGLYRQDYCGCVYSLRRDYDPGRRDEAGKYAEK